MGLCFVLASVLWLVYPLLGSVGTNPRVLVLLAPYLKALLWGILPLLFYTAFRRYLQAMNIVKPLTLAAISANLVNIVGDWALIYGHLGARAMGLAGSGWSTRRRDFSPGNTATARIDHALSIWKNYGITRRQSQPLLRLRELDGSKCSRLDGLRCDRHIGRADAPNRAELVSHVERSDFVGFD